MTKSGKRKRQGVLSDHKRVGKRFIPPLVDAIRLNELRWVDIPLPELLWLGLLNDRHGLGCGAELAVETARAAMAAHGSSKATWFAPSSAYRGLTSKRRKALIETLRVAGHLDDLKSALEPLIALYPECPLAFIFEGGPPQGDPEHGVAALKRVVASVFDKTTREATLMQASATYIAFATGMLRVASHVSLANFPEVANYPSTEESRRVASGVRALITSLFGMSYEASSWPRYFWNRGLEIDQCTGVSHE